MVDDDAAGEDRLGPRVPDRDRMLGPGDEIVRGRVPPRHPSPDDVVRVGLEEQVVGPLVVNQPVGVVSQVRSAAKCARGRRCGVGAVPAGGAEAPPALDRTAPGSTDIHHSVEVTGSPRQSGVPDGAGAPACTAPTATLVVHGGAIGVPASSGGAAGRGCGAVFSLPPSRGGVLRFPNFESRIQSHG